MGNSKCHFTLTKAWVETPWRIVTCTSCGPGTFGASECKSTQVSFTYGPNGLYLPLEKTDWSFDCDYTVLGGKLDGNVYSDGRTTPYLTSCTDGVVGAYDLVDLIPIWEIGYTIIGGGSADKSSFIDGQGSTREVDYIPFIYIIKANITNSYVKPLTNGINYSGAIVNSYIEPVFNSNSLNGQGTISNSHLEFLSDHVSTFTGTIDNVLIDIWPKMTVDNSTDINYQSYGGYQSVDNKVEIEYCHNINITHKGGDCNLSRLINIQLCVINNSNLLGVSDSRCILQGFDLELGKNIDVLANNITPTSYNCKNIIDSYIVSNYPLLINKLKNSHVAIRSTSSYDMPVKTIELSNCSNSILHLGTYGAALNSDSTGSIKANNNVIVIGDGNKGLFDLDLSISNIKNSILTDKGSTDIIYVNSLPASQEYMDVVLPTGYTGITGSLVIGGNSLHDWEGFNFTIISWPVTDISGLGEAVSFKACRSVLRSKKNIVDLDNISSIIQDSYVHLYGFWGRSNICLCIQDSWITARVNCDLLVINNLSLHIRGYNTAHQNVSDFKCSSLLWTHPSSRETMTELVSLNDVTFGCIELKNCSLSEDYITVLITGPEGASLYVEDIDLSTIGTTTGIDDKKILQINLLPPIELLGNKLNLYPNKLIKGTCLMYSKTSGQLLSKFVTDEFKFDKLFSIGVGKTTIDNYADKLYLKDKLDGC